MKTPAWMFVAFFAVFLLLYGGAHLYIYWRLVHDAKITGAYVRFFQAAFIALCVSFPFVHIAFRHQTSFILNIANYISAVWIGMIAYLFLLVLAFDLLLFISYLLHFVLPFDLWHAMPTPRQRALFITLAAAAICSYGLIEAGRIGVTDLKIKLPGFPRNMDGFRLVQISDVHMGTIVKGNRLEKIVKIVSSLKPDAIVITGDLVDEQALHMEDMVKPLQKLQSHYGVYAVTGNHEFFAGIEKASEFMKRSGIELLRNRWVSLADAIQLVGRDDPAARRIENKDIPSLHEILQGIDRSKPVILLYHSPVTRFDELEANGIHLQLSGHTHKGQLWPFNYIVKMIYKTPYGLFTSGKTAIYVSNGTGTWGPPMRVGARPEITLLELYAE